jgi:hypothetical protein
VNKTIETQDLLKAIVAVHALKPAFLACVVHLYDIRDVKINQFIRVIRDIKLVTVNSPYDY